MGPSRAFKVDQLDVQLVSRCSKMLCILTGCFSARYCKCTPTEKHMNTSMPTSEGQEMKLLLEQLSYLPLAIAPAAAYVKLSNITLEDYRARLVWIGKTQNPVTMTLSTSLDQICQNHPSAAKYLFLIACVYRKDIPLGLLGQASPLERERRN